MLKCQQIFAFICLMCCFGQLIEAATLFHFGFDFVVKDAEEHFNKTIEVKDNHISVIDNLTGERESSLETESSTSSPNIESINELRSQQIKLNEDIDKKLTLIKEVVEKLKRELTPLVGRNDFIASKVKLTTRYLNALEVETVRLRKLGKFVDLVDELKATPTDQPNGERTMEYVLMKLALEKYNMYQLQREVQDMMAELHIVHEAWDRYVKLKLVEVTI